jgi:hypothetical protein
MSAIDNEIILCFFFDAKKEERRGFAEFIPAVCSFSPFSATKTN